MDCTAPVRTLWELTIPYYLNLYQTTTNFQNSHKFQRSPIVIQGTMQTALQLRSIHGDTVSVHVPRRELRLLLLAERPALLSGS